MATRVELPSLPPELAALPFLFMPRRAGDRDWDFRTSLTLAAAAESAVEEPRNTRRRVAFLLCELGCQYARRSGAHEAAVPLSRTELARTLGVSLCKTKRILALLSLSQVIVLDGDALRILDWRRLCAMAGYDGERLGLDLAEEAEELPEEAPRLVTGAGDQAYFG